MQPVDIEAYYAEQDARMNLPDDFDIFNDTVMAQAPTDTRVFVESDNGQNGSEHLPTESCRFNVPTVIRTASTAGPPEQSTSKRKTADSDAMQHHDVRHKRLRTAFVERPQSSSVSPPVDANLAIHPSDPPRPSAADNASLLSVPYITRSPRDLSSMSLRSVQQMSAGSLDAENSSTMEDISLFSESPEARLVTSVLRKASTTAQRSKGILKSKKRTEVPRKYVQLYPQPVAQLVEENEQPSSPIENISLSTSDFVPQLTSTQKGKAVKQMLSQKVATTRAKVIKLDSKNNPNSERSASPGAFEASSPSSSTSHVVGSTSASIGQNSISKLVKQAVGKKAPSTAPAKKSAAKGKGKSGKKPTPYEFAVTLVENAAARAAENPDAKPKHPQYLRGKRIFYCGGDNLYASESTRNKMSLIIRHGGTLLPTYDAALATHIVTDGGEAVTLRVLGLRSLKDIPEHIPVVRWGWVVAGKDRGRRSQNQGREEMELDMDDCITNAAFHIRRGLRAQISRGKLNERSLKGKERAFEQEQARSTAQESTSREADTSTISYVKSALPKALSVVYPQSENLIQSFYREFTLVASTREDTATGVPGPSGQMPVSPPPSPKTRPARARLTHHLPTESTHDPLSEFYAQARAERDDLGDQEMSDNDTENEDFQEPKGPPPRRGFTCDKKETQRNTGVNQDIINKLQELMELHRAKPGSEDRWRVYSYGKCIRALRNHPTRIRSLAEARSIRGVGEKTAQKIMEILSTGELQRIRYERTEDVTVTNIFQGIYGVGQSTAWKWYANGCRTLEDIKAGVGGVKLSPAQEIGLKFYDDINSRMPRSEAQAIFNLVKPIALSIDPNLFIEIMGSFRRGKATCGDIDIMITRDPKDGQTHAGVVNKLLLKLHEAGIVTEDLALPDDGDDLECIYRGLCRLPAEDARRRRLDILAIPWQSRGAALLYYTGDDIFNRAMRLKANYMGYSLNQRGLFKGVIRDPRDRRVKTNQGSLLASETEKEIFDILGVPWQEPHERVRG